MTDSGGDLGVFTLPGCGLHFICSRSHAIKTNEHLLPQVGS